MNSETMPPELDIFISLLGDNSNEDPGISPNVMIENPLGILGLWISYYFIKIVFISKSCVFKDL